MFFEVLLNFAFRREIEKLLGKLFKGMGNIKIRQTLDSVFIDSWHAEPLDRTQS